MMRDTKRAEMTAKEQDILKAGSLEFRLAFKDL
jgi:hypothetical protein